MRRRRFMPHIRRSGRVEQGKEKEWMQRSVREALWLAQITDEMVHSDKELS